MRSLKPLNSEGRSFFAKVRIRVHDEGYRPTRWFGFVLIVCGLCLSTPVMLADNEGYRDNFEGHVVVVTLVWLGDHFDDVAVKSAPRLLKTTLDSAWGKGRPDTEKKIREQTEASIRKNVGPGSRDVVCTLARSGELRAKLEGRTLKLRYVLHHNEVDFYVTTGGFTSPKFLDPHFNVTFDAEIVLSIPVPESPGILQATEARILIHNTKIDSKNATADLVKAIAGPSVFASTERSLNDRSEDKKNEVNQILAQETASIPREAERIQKSAGREIHLFVEPEIDNNLLRIRLIPPPRVPTGVRAFNYSDTNVGISWSAGDNITERFEVEIPGRRVPGRTPFWNSLAQLPPNKKGYDDNPQGRTASTGPLAYRVCAVNAAGRSCSDSVQVETPSVNSTKPGIRMPSENDVTGAIVSNPPVPTKPRRVVKKPVPRD